MALTAILLMVRYKDSPDATIYTVKHESSTAPRFQVRRMKKAVSITNRTKY